ncbi:MAG: arsenate reductase (thioredoxin) [Firmicutes bacterium]|nr:arsenate reductase (thioredoxin) [Bacillota bacterium]
MEQKPIIYFLCTGNSCRSQMAEGFGKRILGDRFDVYSAGIEAHGIHPMAVRVMAEVGTDISMQTSDVIDPDLLQRAACVITLCGHANERCPVTPPGVKRLHWDLEDPAKAEGSEEERLAVFRKVRDEIRRRIEALAADGPDRFGSFPSER